MASAWSTIFGFGVWSSWSPIWEQDGTNVSFISHIHVRFLSSAISLIVLPTLPSPSSAVLLKVPILLSRRPRRSQHEEKLRLSRVKRLFLGCYLWKHVLPWLGSCGFDRFDGILRVSPRSPCPRHVWNSFWELEMPSRSTYYRSTSG